jgi:hypothetical protein
MRLTSAIYMRASDRLRCWIATPVRSSRRHWRTKVGRPRVLCLDSAAGRGGIEATGSMGWFLRLMEELAIECRVGHPTAIRKAETRRQKHDRRDAALLLQLLAEDRFPAIWMPSTEYRDLRSLLLYRHQWVRMRTRVQNALHAIVLAHLLILAARAGSLLQQRTGRNEGSGAGSGRYGRGSESRKTGCRTLS